MSPASGTGPLSTPVRANAQTHDASKIKTTPSSRGATVISDNIGVLGVKVEVLRPWIQQDIEQAKQCKVDAMLQALLQRASRTPETMQPDSELLRKCLKAVLPVCNGQVPAGDISSSGIKEALHAYARPGKENSFYGPFIKATNIALACLEKIKVEGMRDPVPAVDMICQQNDMPMYQTHQTETSMRKPDLVLLPLNTACSAFPAVTDGEEGKQSGEKKDNEKDTAMDDEKNDEKRKKKRKAHMDNNAIGKPPKNLSWTDILACIELKRKPLGKTKGLTPPPSSYTGTDYVPTKPEYLRVAPRKAEASPPDPSQTSAPQPSSGTASAVQSSGLTTTKASLGEGGSSSKRKAEETLESVTKRPKIDSDVTDFDIDVAVQTGLYAAEMFASNIGVNYLLNIIVVDDVMWIWYYDRQGIIQCSGINFIQDLPRFMVLLYALQRFELHDWGRNKAFLPVQVEGEKCHKFEIKDKDLGTVDLLLHTSHQERVTHYGLKGRATNVVPVTSEALAKKYPDIQDGMVAKIFWGEASRTSEAKILERVAEIAKEHESVKGHIPELLWHHTFTNPTSAFREALGVPEPTTGSRVLYILVFRKLNPITKLRGYELFDVWYQCILCHITLWKKGVHHRDVSPPNLMWYKKGGKLIGVLNDYDLSSLANEPGPRGNERTGTVPFMACDLLTEKGLRGEVKHLYRHDLESFVWCFAWISLRYNEEGVLRPRGSRPFDEWVTLGAMACGDKKFKFQADRDIPACTHKDDPMWMFVSKCLDVLDTRAFVRRKRLQDDLEAGTVTNSQESESERDMDDFLAEFTGTRAWAAISNLSR